jgi:prepilin-type N-terminal cleavage/methylation domain-containing protein
MRELRARLRRGPSNHDEGFTLVELVIAVGVFAIFLGVVLTSIISLTKASTQTQVTARSSSAELALFSRLDHQIRYADSINFPGTGSPSGDRYIEFRTPAPSTTAGITLCTQWRFDPTAHTIQSRRWNDTVGTVAGNTWDTLLTNVATDVTVGYPFVLIPASASGSSMQELQITIDSGNTSVMGAAIISTFVARNSGVTSSPSNSDATTPGVSDHPICTGSSRP